MAIFDMSMLCALKIDVRELRDQTFDENFHVTNFTICCSKILYIIYLCFEIPGQQMNRITGIFTEW